MSPQRSQRRGRRAPARQATKEQGLWQRVPAPSPPELIRPTPDPGALITSLGPPPLRGPGSSAEHYLAAVIERAAGLATALAASAELLAERDDDENS
jgi:hypothetical protein